MSYAVSEVRPEFLSFLLTINPPQLGGDCTIVTTNSKKDLLKLWSCKSMLVASRVKSVAADLKLTYSEDEPLP